MDNQNNINVRPSFIPHLIKKKQKQTEIENKEINSDNFSLSVKLLDSINFVFKLKLFAGISLFLASLGGIINLFLNTNFNKSFFSSSFQNFILQAFIYLFLIISSLNLLKNSKILNNLPNINSEESFKHNIGVYFNDLKWFLRSISLFGIVFASLNLSSILNIINI
jgi:hypothetical protein